MLIPTDNKDKNTILLILAGVGAAAAGAAVYAYNKFFGDDKKDNKPRQNDIILLCGEVAAGKSSIINWLVNGNFKADSHDATVKRKKHEVFSTLKTYDIYDTSGSFNEDTEGLKERLLNEKSVINVYVFDISKLKDKEFSDRIDRGIRLCKDEADKHGWKAFAIGTHATESGLSVDEIREQKNRIKTDLNVECEFYELDPAQREEYHPQISKDALLDKICEISSNS